MYIGDLRNGETVQCRRQACYRNIDAANCCAATRIDAASAALKAAAAALPPL